MEHTHLVKGLDSSAPTSIRERNIAQLTKQLILFNFTYVTISAPSLERR